MRSVLVPLDEATKRALDRVAPAAKRQRSEFIRTAIRKAIGEAEESRTRAAYSAQPDGEWEGGDWSQPEVWKP